MVVEYNCAILKSAASPRPALNKTATTSWVCELDDRLGYDQPLLWVEIHLVIIVFELNEALHLLSHLVKIWFAFWLHGGRGGIRSCHLRLRCYIEEK